MLSTGRRLLGSVALLSLVSGSASLAGDFVVESSSTLTNGGAVLDGSDSIIVSGSTVIETPGPAILASGDSNRIDNGGQLVTLGYASAGVSALDLNRIGNGGAISTRQAYSAGINGRNANEIISSGSIVTVGNGSHGIRADDRNGIFNSGTIEVQGVGAHGISSANGNLIESSGSIDTKGDLGYGISVYGSSVILNSGRISTARRDSPAIAAGNGNEIVSNGEISTRGDRSVGIAAQSANRIFQSGSIVVYGDRAHGIRSGENNVIANHGSIAVSGDHAQGVNARIGNAVHNAGEIETQGIYGYGVSVYSDNRIENTGRISTHGAYSPGIAAGDENRIVTSGSIVTFGNFAPGIGVSSRNEIVQEGSLTTSGYKSNGIDADDGNIIRNSGAIDILGAYSRALALGTGNRFENGGVITMHGYGADAIAAGSGNAIVNSGRITTLDASSDGIHAGNGNRIVNTGIIETSRDYASGISVGDGNTIVNSGRIRLSGRNAAGIRAGDGNSITHEGVIESLGRAAIELGYGNTLNLISPGFIQGRIRLGGDTTINLVSATGHSAVWDLSEGQMVGGAPTLSGPVPWFYDPVTRIAATFDPAMLSSAAEFAADLGGDLDGLIASRLTGGWSNAIVSQSAIVPGHGGAAPMLSTQARLEQAFSEATSTSGGDTGSNWWMTGFGGRAHQASDAGLRRRAVRSGLAIGFDSPVSPELTFGMMAGWSAGDDSATNANFQTAKSRHEGYFAALYGRIGIQAAFADLALMGGVQEQEAIRFANNNLAVNGIQQSAGTWGSWWVAPQAGIGIALPGPAGWTLTPHASVRWTYQSFEGYSETGTAVNATVGERDHSVLEARAQLSGERLSSFGAIGWRAGMQWRSSAGGDTNVTLIGQTRTLSGLTDDRATGFLGGTLDLNLSARSRLSFDAEGSFGENHNAARGSLNLVTRF